jgi:hypothetical protein
VKTLSKQHEESLIGAVKQAVSYVDGDGMTPDQAIEKVARSNKWNRELIKLAAHAYNTGRQTAQRETSTSLMDKFAAFPLVDPTKVIKKIWPGSVKSAADEALETSVSDEYNAPPAWIGRESPNAHLKTAEFKLVDTPPAPLEPDPEQVMKRAYNIHLDHKRTVETARTEAGVAHDRLLQSMGELGDYFRKNAHDRHSFANIEHAVRTYYPASARTLMDYVHQRNGGKEVRAADSPMPTVRMDRDAAPFTLLDHCMDCAKAVKTAEAEHANAQAAMQKQGEALRPFAQTPSPLAGNQTHSLIPEGAVETKQANILGGAALGIATQDMLNRAMADLPEPTAKLREDELLELTDPRHEDELRRIRAQALLSEMMQDPVIGGHEPHEVFRAYNELSQAAPRLSTQAMSVRPMLRRILQGDVEPFEAKEVTEIEKGLRDIERPTPTGQLESPADAIT